MDDTPGGARAAPVSRRFRALPVLLVFPLPGVLLVPAYLSETFGLYLPMGAVLLTLGVALLALSAVDGSKLRLGLGASLLAGVVAGSAVAVLVGRGLETTSRERGNRIVAALAECRRAEGRYPSALDHLVPRYLPEIPRTALGWFRSDRFRYVAGRIAYELSFECVPDYYECSRGPTWEWRCGD